jgi:hypothetical protein
MSAPEGDARPFQRLCERGGRLPAEEPTRSAREGDDGAIFRDDLICEREVTRDVAQVFQDASGRQDDQNPSFADLCQASRRSALTLPLSAIVPSKSSASTLNFTRPPLLYRAALVADGP